MAEKLITREFDITTPDGKCDCYAVYPDRPTPMPAVLFYMDAFGLRPWLYEMAQKMAAQGYYVLLPNLFYRGKRSPLLDVTYPLRMEDMDKCFGVLRPLMMSSITPEGVKMDAEAFLKFLDQQKEVKRGPVGLTGYCLGGREGLRVACDFPDRIGAFASFHAANTATEAENSPHLGIPRIKAEVYIAHADKDQFMGPEQIERIRKALDAAHVKYREELYEGAAHGFTMKDLPNYNDAAMDRHWKALFDLFKRRLT